MSDYIENENTAADSEETEVTEDTIVDCYVATLTLTGTSLTKSEEVLLGFFLTDEMATRAGKFVRDNFSHYYPGKKCAIAVKTEEFDQATIQKHVDTWHDTADLTRSLGPNGQMTKVFDYWADYMAAISQSYRRRV